MLVNSSIFSELKLVSPQSIIQLLGLLLIAMMGAAVTTLMPLLVGAYTDSGLFTDAQVGWLTSADIAGTLIASASAYFWSRKVNWRFVTIVSTIIFITANWLTLSISSFESLYVTRLLAGIGCGAAYAISLAALGDYKKSDMAFSAMVTIQVVFGTVGFWILPSLIGNYGLAGIFQFFNACLIPALILCFITYPSNQKIQDSLGLNIDGNVKAALYVFFGVVAYYFAQGTVWAYLERMGVAVNLSGAEVGEILGIGFAISALGSMLSGLYVAKWGRNSGLYITAIIQLPCLVALYMMGENNAFWIYAIATIIYQVLWSFIIPIMMAIFNDIDKSGKLIVLCVSAFKVGLVIGPPVAGLVVTYFQVKEVLWLGGVAIIASVWITVKANELIKTDNEYVVLPR